jgi:hypothetical protein
MNWLLDLIAQLYCFFCRHDWVRDRRQDGRLGLRCMKCMKQKEHDLLRIIEWRPDYAAIEPGYFADFPLPLQPSKPVKAQRIPHRPVAPNKLPPARSSVSPGRGYVPSRAGQRAA